MTPSQKRLVNRPGLSRKIPWIRLIAERVERLSDLAILDEVGVEWAQGYCLSRPVSL